ncbi:MAG TPA: glycosyltransferase [Thermoanaerobaculia bacterium]|nr:glycosyltransferase [Thermoanaerobaculia bacterium]
MSTSIAFLVPTPPPVVPEAEAYGQEIDALCRRFGGERFYINPNRLLPRHLPVQLPRPLFGFLELPRLRRAGNRHGLYQIYSPTLYLYPVLAFLARPVVYTLTGHASLRSDQVEPFRRFAAVTVPDRDSLRRLREEGLKNVRRVRAGIDTRRFSVQPRTLDGELHLLMASAPWTPEQFRTKGIDALLAAAEADPRLRLTLLWRGVLTAAVKRRIRERNLEDRVEVVDRVVDVDQQLAAVHATIVLAESGDLVKAYPHSLIESLVAGKPVLVSRNIPMAGYVAAKGVGVVVDGLAVKPLLDALEWLRCSYRDYERNAVEHGRRDFDLEGMIASFAAVYAELCSPDARRTE